MSSRKFEIASVVTGTMADKINFEGSTAFYESVFEHNLAGFAYIKIIFDAESHPIDFIYLKVNKRFQELTGLKNVEGKRVTELIPRIEKSNPELIEAYGQVALTGKPKEFEIYLEQLSSYFLVSAYSTEKDFVMVTFQNITESKLVLKKLKDQMTATQNILEDLNTEKLQYKALTKDLEKFKLAADNVSDQVVITDPDGIVLYINKVAERITGFTIEEILNKKVASLWHSPMPLAFYQNLWKTIKTDKKTFIGELRNRRKNGEMYDVELKISPVLNDKNEVVFFVGIERDITQEKILIQTKDDLIAKDDAILKSIADGLVVTDRDGIITLINPAFEQLTGWKSHEAVGQSFANLIPREDENGRKISFTARILEQVLKGKIILVTSAVSDFPDAQSMQGEITQVPSSYFIRKDGTKFPVIGVVGPIRSGDKIIGAVETFHDITKEKEVDRAKSEFITLASHQLRTPPSIISWYTETLQAGDLGPMNEKQTEYVAEIRKANQRMIAIVNSLLNISRVEMNTFTVSAKEIDIKNIVEDTAKELMSRFDRKIELKTSFDPILKSYRADPNIIQIVIDNLLSNAFKYTPPENTKIEIATKIENNSLLLSVKDNGIGIPLKDRDRVFEKLFRADNAVTANPDGTGLGLYMIKKIIVDGLGGKIWFDTEENKGSTFYVSLPASGMQEKAGTTVLARVQNF